MNRILYDLYFIYDLYGYLNFNIINVLLYKNYQADFKSHIFD